MSELGLEEINLHLGQDTDLDELKKIMEQKVK